MITPSRPLHTGRLVLTPSDAGAWVELDPLGACLKAAGCIGSTLEGRADAFEVGDRFPQLIAFTGCAVAFDTAPSDTGHRFTHVVLRGPYSAPRLLSGRNTRPPRCPECGKGLVAWRDQLRQQHPEPTPELRCMHCMAAAPGWHWHWGRHGGFGRCFVCIEEVFPGEGSPLPALLDALGSLGIGDWQFFYVQD